MNYYHLDKRKLIGYIDKIIFYKKKKQKILWAGFEAVTFKWNDKCRLWSNNIKLHSVIEFVGV